MRVELKGDAQPDPIFALPDPGSESTLPSLVLNLPNGVPFLPAQYIEQGYNHYEVWCIGGVGGQGGNAYDAVLFASTSVTAVMPPAVWTDYWTHALDSPSGHYWIPDSSGNLVETDKQGYYEHGNPTHQAEITTYGASHLINPRMWGGGGGGGGLHVVSGLLLVLPEEVPVIVGQAGVDGVSGQMAVNGAQTPTPSTYPWSGVYMQWANQWPTPHTSYNLPGTGGDGGTSSFNGSLCQSSGGKGGGPAMIWSGGARYADGHGGAGGSGNRLTSGGGAAGSSSSAVGTDGTWDGAIGKGGGGGRGGTMSPAPPSQPWAV